MKLAVCGFGRSGKDTVAEWLADNTPLRYTHSTSKQAAEIVYADIVASHERAGGQPPWDNARQCWLARHEGDNRALWAAIIWKYNQPDGVRLYCDMVEGGCDILTGIRKKAELDACRQHGLIDLAIWVDRPGCHESKASNEITPGDCDLTISNHGALDELHAKLGRVVSHSLDTTAVVSH